MRGRFGLFGGLFLLLFVLLVGGIGFALGQSTVPAAATADGARVVYGWGFWHPFGWVFGLLFVFFLFWLIFRAFRPRHWGPGGWGRGYGRGWGGPGGWGYGPGSQFNPNDPNAPEWTRDVPPPFRPMLENWHRQAHGSAGSTPPGTTGPTTSPTGDTSSTGPTATGR